MNLNYPRISLITVAILSLFTMNLLSRAGNGTVTSGAFRRTGAATRWSNAFSFTRVITSVAIEPVWTASETTNRRPVFLTDVIIVSVSIGLIVLKSMTSIEYSLPSSS